MDTVTCQWKEVSVLLWFGGLLVVCSEGVCVDFLMWWLVLLWCSHLLEGGSSLDGVLSPLAWKPPGSIMMSDLCF